MFPNIVLRAYIYLCAVIENIKFKSANKNHQLLKKKCEETGLLFIDNSNITISMLNKSGIHLNDYGTTRLVNNFCFNINA